MNDKVWQTKKFSCFWCKVTEDTEIWRIEARENVEGKISPLVGEDDDQKESQGFVKHLDHVEMI